MNDDFDFSETPSSEQVARHLSAMGDSVWVINSMIENGPGEGQTQEGANDEVDRNVRHLEIMLAKEYIQDSGSELATFQVAVTDGNAYIASHSSDKGGSVKE
jgi:hypothetical protein